VRVVIAEDSVLLREGLAGLLGRFGFEVAAAVGDAPALLAAVEETAPALVITDVRMPPTFTDEGLRTAVALRATRPGLPVLALSQWVQHSYASELLASGDGRAVGYLLKDRVADVAQFTSAIRHIANGGSIVDPSLVAELLGASSRQDPLKSLTGREREVLSLLAQGRTDRGIAKELFLAPKTVEAHVRSIFRKLDLPADATDNRRVHAVLTVLRARQP
jgi:DNA-binding NarL/FixJ family response regulator